MAIEFNTMASLLEPGHHRMVYTHFGLEEAFIERFMLINDPITQHVDALLKQYQETGEDEHLHECYLLKKAFALVDEYVKPQSMGEVACCTFLVSTLLGRLSPMIFFHQAHARMQAQASPNPHYYGPTATA